MRRFISGLRRFARFAGGFALGSRGAAAVEFALVSIPFLALTFGIIEIGLIYFVSTTLENATLQAAREIRTGQLQQAGGAIGHHLQDADLQSAELAGLELQRQPLRPACRPSRASSRSPRPARSRTAR